MNEFDEKELALRRRVDRIADFLNDLAKYARRSTDFYCRKEVQHLYSIDEMQKNLDKIETEVIKPIQENLCRLYGTTPEEFDTLWRNGLDSMFASSFCRRCAQSQQPLPRTLSEGKAETGWRGDNCEGL